ncbi:MAG TPA: hypothetical protein VGB37_08630 [Candidatus Lokiarchaeia archaeon]
MRNLPDSLQNISQQITQNNSISIYQGNLNVKFAIDQFKRLKNAFPNVSPVFNDILMERIKENKFTNQRLKDAIDNLIDNFCYPNPSISNIISFDKRVKLHPYGEVCELVYNGWSFEDFAHIKIKGKLFWITKAEKEQYKILDEY